MTKLTKLEEELYEVIYDRKPKYNEEGEMWVMFEFRNQERIRKLAQVARIYIEEAWRDGVSSGEARGTRIRKRLLQMTKLTKLEEEIKREAIKKAFSNLPEQEESVAWAIVTKEQVVTAAASVARIYIEKAFIDGFKECKYHDERDDYNPEWFNSWAKESGVISSEEKEKV